VISAGSERRGNNQMSVTAIGFCHSVSLNAKPIKPNHVRTMAANPAGTRRAQRVEFSFILLVAPLKRFETTSYSSSFWQEKEYTNGALVGL
jgi:hypothetical protein